MFRPWNVPSSTREQVASRAYTPRRLDQNQWTASHPSKSAATFAARQSRSGHWQCPHTPNTGERTAQLKLEGHEGQGHANSVIKVSTTKTSKVIGGLRFFAPFRRLACAVPFAGLLACVLEHLGRVQIRFGTVRLSQRQRGSGQVADASRGQTHRAPHRANLAMQGRRVTRHLPPERIALTSFGT